MTTTLYSERDDGYLVELAWPAESPEELWAKLFDVLQALEREADALGPVVDPALRAALQARRGEAPPDELELHARPIVVLPDARLEVIDYDSPDLWSLGELPLEPVIGQVAPEGLRAWRIAGTTPQHSKGHALTLRISGELSQWARRLSLDVRSRYDLWLPVQLDGEPNPVGSANAALLATWFDRIAEATGATRG